MREVQWASNPPSVLATFYAFTYLYYCILYISDIDIEGLGVNKPCN